VVIVPALQHFRLTSIIEGREGDHGSAVDEVEDLRHDAQPDRIPHGEGRAAAASGALENAGVAVSKLTVWLFTALFMLLAAVGWFAYAGLANGNSAMPTEGYLALTIGVMMSVLVGVGLMVLLFYSRRRRGYDDPRRFRDKP
jgi:hypothetical protein